MAIKGGKVDGAGEKITSLRIVTDGNADTGLGDSLDPLRVDPTGTTVQPVSFSSAQHVIVDSGAGGGTQYAEGTTQATPTGTVAFGKDPSNVVKSLPLTAAGNLKVDASAVAVPLAAGSAVIGHVIVDSGAVTTTPPSNASTNVAQIAGTAPDTNSGLKSAGTLRVVLATDQPALTNKLLVTPDSVALPANQSVNVNQVAGASINSANPMPVVGTIATSTTAPAAGAEFSFTVTAGKKWRVTSLRASLVTNATVISRFIRIVIDNGTNIIFAVYADDGQVASDSRNYNFVPGQLSTSDVRGERVVGLPANLWLNAAWRIRSLTDSIQTTDQWSNVTLAVEEMPNL